jgi:hypothetical protein
MDFSEDLPVRAQHLAPSSAMDEQGIDRVAELSATDKNYLVQPQPGNRVFLEFPAGAVPAGARQSAFLHTRGYYEYVRDYKNKPDVATLETFRDAGALARFSKEKFNRFASDKNLASKAFSGSR